MLIFLDLDGPILECSDRHYAVYAQVCSEAGLEPLPPQTYWEQKRQRVRVLHPPLLAKWIERVEQPQYLKLDTIQPHAAAVLARWAARGDTLRLVTLRRHQEHLREQLEDLGLTRFFDRVIVCDPALGGKGKADRAALGVPPAELRASIWIGDTEVDAAAAAELGCAKLYLVSCGIRTEEYLRSLDVGEVVGDLAEAGARL